MRIHMLELYFVLDAVSYLRAKYESITLITDVGM